MPRYKENDSEIDPAGYVQENREKILRIVRSSDDPFMRAYAWALLDKHTDTLHQELDRIANRDRDE
jgi:hypothetical protein